MYQRKNYIIYKLLIITVYEYASRAMHLIAKSMIRSIFPLHRESCKSYMQENPLFTPKEKRERERGGPFVHGVGFLFKVERNRSVVRIFCSSN